MIRHSTRDEGLRILQGEGAILEIAREVSALMRAAGIDGAIVGGVAVVLHGHVRTTIDVDVYVPEPLESFSTVLQENGFEFDADRREFVKRGVAVHLVKLEQIKHPPKKLEEIEQITTVSLADLINMKLRSGSSNVLRAQDLADVIGLIRHHKLSAEFVPRIDKNLRVEYRRLVKAVANDTL